MLMMNKTKKKWLNSFSLVNAFYDIEKKPKFMLQFDSISIRVQWDFGGTIKKNSPIVYFFYVGWGRDSLIVEMQLI